jgi:hypothetical protein
LKKFSSAIHSSLTPAEEALLSLTKGAQNVAYGFELRKARIEELEEANAAYTKRKSRKQKHLQTTRALSTTKRLELAAAKQCSTKWQCLQAGGKDGGETITLTKSSVVYVICPETSCQFVKD